MAGEYRQKFGHDVVIDLIGYRLMGHNELDQPKFTQPLMYKQVDKMVPVARKYEKQLLEDGTMTQEEIDKEKGVAQAQLEEAYVKSKNLQYKAEDWVTDEWAEIMQIDQKEAIISGIKESRLRSIGKAICTLPAEGNFHRLITKIFNARVESISTGKGIDWGTAEALAMASLIQDGFKVRISGQDVERGTFSHRHAHVFY